MCESSKGEVVIVSIGVGQKVGRESLYFHHPLPHFLIFEHVSEEYALFSMAS